MRGTLKPLAYRIDLEGRIFQPPPKTRGECENGIRPCPHSTCRHHLASDLSAAGALKIRELEPGADSCALDVISHAGMSHEEVGGYLGVTGQRVEQIEKKALAKLAKYARVLKES